MPLERHSAPSCSMGIRRPDVYSMWLRKTMRVRGVKASVMVWTISSHDAAGSTWTTRTRTPRLRRW